MDSKQRFSNRVENYVKYRPSYPDSAVTFLYDSIGINKTDTIADIGSGTGIFTKLLLEHGNTVFGVEPNNEMRKYAETHLSQYNNYISINGSAEDTNLEDNSIDAVVSAQAFHWFNRIKAKAEFKRILKPERKIILIWNKRLKDSDLFSMRYEDLLLMYANDYKEVSHDNIGIDELNVFFKDGVFSQKSFDNFQVFDYEGLLGRYLSSSYAPLPGESNYEPLTTKLKEIFDRYNVDGKVRFSYKTILYWGKV